MADVRKVVHGGAADAPGGRVGGDDLGKGLLDREELAGEGVVLGVADLGAGEGVVEVLVPAELVAQPAGAQRSGVRVFGKRHGLDCRGDAARRRLASRRRFPAPALPKSREPT